MENYLILDPEAVADKVNNQQAPNLPPRKSRTDMLRELLDLGDSQVPLIAANTVALAAGRGHVLGSEKWAFDRRTRSQIEQTVDDAGHPWREQSARVERMHGSINDSPEDRWHAMNRLVDGKRVLWQLCGSGNTKDVFRADLATLQRGKPKIVRELVDILNEFKAEARRIANATV